MRKKQKDPEILFCFLVWAQQRDQQHQGFCSWVELTHRAQRTVTETLPSVLRHRHWCHPIWEQCPGSRLWKRSKRGRPPGHWDIRAAYLFLSFGLCVCRNKENRHRKEAIQYSVRSIFSKNLFSFSLLLVETDQILVCVKSVQPEQC